MTKTKWYQRPVYLLVALALVLSLGIVAVPMAGTVAAATINVGPGETYTTIQAAIDAAIDGDTICVHEETYNEALVIDGTDLSLVAIGEVTINNPSTSSKTIAIYDSVCTIDGFTVQGGHTGIYAAGSNLLGTSPFEVNVTIRNNTVGEYRKNGITVNGELATAQIYNNTVNGRGMLPYGDLAQNGIQLGWGTTGIIRSNVVSDNWYIGGYWTACNILLYDTTDVMVLKNTSINGQSGIFVMGNNNKVNSNRFEGELYGRYPADWPPVDPPVDWYDDGSWAIGVYGENNKVVHNTIDTYDVGIEIWDVNNKVIRNTFVNVSVEKQICDYGDQTKVHANVVQ